MVLRIKTGKRIPKDGGGVFTIKSQARHDNPDRNRRWNPHSHFLRRLFNVGSYLS